MAVKDQQTRSSHGVISNESTNSAKKSVIEDFWLPRVSGALNKGKKIGKQSPGGQFQHVVKFTL